MSKEINKAKLNWEGLANSDPLWAILTDPEKKGGRWSKKEFFDTGIEEINSLINKLNQKGIKYNPITALDFGCGVGRLTQPLSSKFQQTIGVDLSEKMIKLAEEINQKSNCKYLVNSSDKLEKFSDNYFDFIYSNIVLQHIKPGIALGYIVEFYRILRKDGVIVFQIPDKFINPVPDLLRNSKISQKYLYRLFLLLKYGSKPVMETYSIRKEKVLDHLAKVGFSVIDIEENRNAGPKWISYTYYCRKK
jgi:ubiquinone/menaquinone biosynthesis C-methylase UbiE